MAYGGYGGGGGAAHGGAAHQLTQGGSMAMKLRLRLSCNDLIKMDSFSKSDPMTVVYLQDSTTGGKFVEIGRTETISNSHNPHFHKCFDINYMFEEVQRLKFAVYDSDSKMAALDGHDFIGDAEATIGEMVGASAGHWSKPLARTGKTGNRGVMHVDTEECSGARGTLHFSFRGVGLDKKDFWGKSDPYLEIWQANAQGTYTLVHKTETIKKTLNPTWRPFTMEFAALCNGDPSRPLRFKVWDWDSDGSNDLIGTADTTYEQMKPASGAPGKMVFDLINPKKVPGGKKHKKGYKNSGELHLMGCTFEQEVGFLEHLQNGLEMNFAVGIDFTGSNGDPRTAGSLHYINPYKPNEYIAAMQAVGGVIQDYDSDKMFPTHGFGAKMADGRVSHCFSLTGDEANPYCAGVDGIIAMYKQAIGRVQLWGPTNFAPIIQATVSVAQAAHSSAAKGTTYYVLLMVTDGAITDMAATKDVIVAASHLPISIIIIGVGGADFSSMNILDGDEPNQLRNSRGETCQRDIVQFVPYRHFQSNPVALAHEVLHEVPEQVCSYMKANSTHSTV